MPSEIETKLQRLSAWCDRHNLDGVLLTLRSNFSWITCGRDNHIANNTPVGVASILASKDGKRVCLTNTIESPRMRLEELSGTGIETIDFPWWDDAAKRKTVQEVIAGRKIAADSDGFGASAAGLPGDFNELRWSLTDDEVTRYRDGGKRAAAAMERACRALKPGMTEHEVAARLDHEIHAAAMNPVVTLVSSDERALKFRHPIPTEQKIRDHVMLVTCAARGGLISCLTRFVRFSKPSTEWQKKHQAICNIDAAVNLATRAGRTLGQVFDDLRKAYADNGYADEWQNHHQGGSCGYNGRDVVATPGSTVKVMENQPFAWNPSIAGAKSEDTVLCGPRGIEVLTAHSNDWPSVTGESDHGTLRRADVLTL
jgi:Xaa-Pro dipeptidase